MLDLNEAIDRRDSFQTPLRGTPRPPSRANGRSSGEMQTPPPGMSQLNHSGPGLEAARWRPMSSSLPMSVVHSSSVRSRGKNPSVRKRTEAMYCEDRYSDFARISRNTTRAIVRRSKRKTRHVLRSEERAPSDLSRIHTGEVWEVRWWSVKFGVTKHQLRKAVEAVGPTPAQVKRHLRRRPGNRSRTWERIDNFAVVKSARAHQAPARMRAFCRASSRSADHGRRGSAQRGSLLSVQHVSNISEAPHD